MTEIVDMQPGSPEQLKEMQTLLDQWEKKNDDTIADIDEKMYRSYSEYDECVVGPKHFGEESPGRIGCPREKPGQGAH